MYDITVSDLHNKVFGQQYKTLIRTVKEANADFIVLTGDVIDRHTADLENVFTLIEQLTAMHQAVFFVSGNHEWNNAFTQDFFAGLRDRNVTVLDNEHLQLAVHHVKLNLVGISDASTKHEDMQRAFDGIDQECYTILLSHTPSIVETYNDIQADLILSGHTHGGQIRMPFLGAIVAPDQGFFPKLDKGVFNIGREKYLYIDSGIGTSNLPIRFLNKSQVSLITIANNQ